MNHEALARLFYREVWKALSHTEWTDEDRIQRLYRLLQLLFVETTRQEGLQFSTLFARMAYAGHRYELSASLQYYLHTFRRLAAQTRHRQAEMTDTELLQLGAKALCTAITAMLGTNPPAELQPCLPHRWPVALKTAERKAFHHQMRVLALADDPAQQHLLARSEAAPDTPLRIAYNVTAHNENFQPTISAIQKIFGFPLTLNLIDVDVDEQGLLRPKAFVVEPDYLTDVSAIAACFREGMQEPWLYLLDKFKPYTTSKHRIIGHIANFFLDELMSNPEADFKSTFPKVFRLYPLAFCLLSEQDMRDVYQGVQKHFVNLQRMARQDFAANRIQPAHCFLEPSFFSETYGLQGRLDVFCHPPDDNGHAAIVELKSGKPFHMNAYRISHDHFVQTLLYDLMIQSVFGPQLKPANYILYSGQDEDPLRFAPRVRTQQYEALQVRNQLVAIDWMLMRLGYKPDEDLVEQGRRLFGRLTPERMPRLKAFARQDVEAFQQMYFGMDDLEQRYFTAFAGFIAREHQLAKTGVAGMQSINGMASLWLNSLEEKQNAFDILQGLEIVSSQAASEEPTLEFARDTANKLANFRQGDIVVLYPATDNPEAGVLSNQIFKCTITALSSASVRVRLRSRQFNDSLFRQYRRWNIEHDMLDVSFVAMYRALWEFAAAPVFKKQLLLGAQLPRQAPPLQASFPDELMPEQQDILRQALAAPDYFLLWGPPGTGKTSMMLKHLVGYLLQHTSENLLLLAYTNRAVDEMCEAIESLGADIRQHYLRIGARYATHPAFHPQLLDVLIEQVSTRKALKQLIDSRRIVLATVASIGSKPEILQLKSFARVIIDEASQILEPALAGLLPRFERFILIGDHKQLPAVVSQSPEESAVHDPALKAIGLDNLRNSLFERLYKLCVAKGCHWAYAQLHRQGRMHQDLMAFPSRFFYHNSLQILPEHTPGFLRQTAAPTCTLPPDATELEKLLAQRRVVFLSTPADEQGAAYKTNRYEAERAADVVGAFQRLYAGRSFSLGVITPYRAQIARIYQELETRGMDAEAITIDTVERYQGGARDVIVISLCTNSLNTLASIVSLSDEGVDRKLNVALTRAREHVVVIGNAELLQGNALYKALVESYGV